MQRDRILAQLRDLRPWLTAQGVVSIALFGSHAHGNPRHDSDVDLVVEFAPSRTPDLFAFAGLKLELERRLGAPVDLFTHDSLHPGLRSRIEAGLVHA